MTDGDFALMAKLAEHYDDLQAFAGEADDLAVQLRFGSRFLDAVQNWLDDLSDKLPPKAVVVAIASAMFDKLAIVIDIPGVPEVGEKWIESALKPYVMKLVEEAYDRVASRGGA